MLAMDQSPPTTLERQRVERLADSVMNGADPAASLGPTISVRLGYVIARMLGEACATAWAGAQGRVMNLSTPTFRRFRALVELFDVAVTLPRVP